MSKPHISNHFLQAAIRGAERLGHDANVLLREAKVPIDWVNQESKRLTEEQLTRLMKVVWRNTKDEFMGFSPHRCKNGFFSLMANYCLPSMTLGTMLKRSAKFYRVTCEDIDIELEEGDSGQNDLVFFRIQLTDARYDDDYFLRELFLLMWQRFSCWLVGQQIPITCTSFSYAPPKHAEEYETMFSGELRFKQASSGFYFRAKYLSLPIVKTSDQLEIILNESPAFILHRPNQDNSWQAKVYQILSEQDFRAMPTLESVAKELHVIPRTIGRKLKDEGTTFRHIKEALLSEYATRLLTTEHLSIAQVSELTGFSEAASFCRAFKRWTGVSPSTFRRVGRGFL